MTTIYLINKLSSKVIKGKTSFEILFGNKPSYGQLTTFGCLVYEKNNNQYDKFREKGKPYVFIGYPQGKKGYKLYDENNREVIVSRDVIFFQNTFPYKVLPTTQVVNE